MIQIWLLLPFDARRRRELTSFDLTLDVDHDELASVPAATVQRHVQSCGT